MCSENPTTNTVYKESIAAALGDEISEVSEVSYEPDETEIDYEDFIND